ncbi:DUF2505 domain-containing protein [Paeniglutamicibacter antarcticus]|uniref:DUF2505 domain-containing protein n=1 Tax=Arthrobacter terrae TaxID=2935737 RepID=A0A931G379_9MICC|nr:DUF2505 domain-containing protein [Arthrobacter terrae]MBG0738356.1 DUF2505 domain-containing protein [Arthrobacter terrae]
MALRATTTLSHPAQRVTAVFTDEDFIRSSTESIGGKLTSFERTGALETAFSTKTVRTLPTDKLPELARKFVGSSITVSQLEDWSAPAADGSREIAVTLSVTGAPLTVTAVERILQQNSGSLVEVEGTVTSAVPFLGTKIVEAAEPMIGKALNLQATHAQKWLDEHRAADPA